MHQVESHINEFAPQNRQNRIDFELTTKAEQVRIFGAILRAINTKGVGLETIQYFNSDGLAVNFFLTLAEVKHLEDVSVLVQLMNSIALILTIVLIFILFAALKYKKTSPNLLASICCMVSFIVLNTGFIIFIGPLVVFNKLHEWIFIDKSQWQFYYQDSLMTTLFKAPDTFASMAILITVTAVAFWLSIFYLINKILK